MSDLDKIPVLKDCGDVGKIPISGGRYIVISTDSRRGFPHFKPRSG